MPDDSLLTRLRVADVMTTDVVAVAPDTSLDTVARQLSANRISGVPVVDASGRAVGVVSVTDLVDPKRKASQTRGFPVFYRIEDGWATPEVDDAVIKAGRAEDVMTPMPFTIESDATLLQAAEAMVEHRVHRLLVTEDGALKGLISTIDVLRGLTEGTREG
ncbi:MAG: CBS domain-containing protein [Myxococcales bacterium]|nr:CBS domain-containing protein [Myxococcales bacterium]